MSITTYRNHYDVLLRIIDHSREIAAVYNAFNNGVNLELKIGYPDDDWWMVLAFIGKHGSCRLHVKDEYNKYMFIEDEGEIVDWLEIPRDARYYEEA